jgi:hypothetical protein
VRRALDASEKTLLSPYFSPVDLDAAVLHDGYVPWYLPRRFVGIVRGVHIYFRAGVYDSKTAEGIALLGHELAHVAQYRSGMTAWRYLRSAIWGYHRCKYERAAFAVQARILQDLKCGDHNPAWLRRNV